MELLLRLLQLLFVLSFGSSQPPIDELRARKKVRKRRRRKVEQKNCFFLCFGIFGAHKAIKLFRTKGAAAAASGEKWKRRKLINAKRKIVATAVTMIVIVG